MSETPVASSLDRNLLGTIDATRRWLSSGRLQSSSGAFCAWRDLADDTLAFEYPEITGYALTWLTDGGAPSAGELDAGRAAAEWIIGRLRAGDRSARAGWEGGAVYTFDLGMIASGLISFGTASGDDTYVERGRKLALSLAEYLAEGNLPAVAPDGPPSHRHGTWSTDGRAHLGKCLQALLLAGADAAADRLMDQTIAQQASDGHFVTQPGDEFVMLHPHLYAVEGLWMCGTALGDKSLLSRARQGTEWAWTHQLASGGLPRWVSAHDAGPEQLDVTSQAIRAAVLLGTQPLGLSGAIARVNSLGRLDGDHGQAFVYQPADLATHLNAWVTMFAGQALSLHRHGLASFRWHDLV